MTLRKVPAQGHKVQSHRTGQTQAGIHISVHRTPKEVEVPGLDGCPRGGVAIGKRTRDRGRRWRPGVKRQLFSRGREQLPRLEDRREQAWLGRCRDLSAEVFPFLFCPDQIRWYGSCDPPTCA
jgi:hypothetical protein